MGASEVEERGHLGDELNSGANIESSESIKSSFTDRFAIAHLHSIDESVSMRTRLEPEPAASKCRKLASTKDMP